MRRSRAFRFAVFALAALPLSIVGQSILFDSKAFGFGDKLVFPMGEAAKGGIAAGGEGTLSVTRMPCAKDCWALDQKSRRLEAAFDPKMPVVRGDILRPVEGEQRADPHEQYELPDQPDIARASGVILTGGLGDAAARGTTKGRLDHLASFPLVPGRATGPFIKLDRDHVITSEDDGPKARAEEGGPKDGDPEDGDPEDGDPEVSGREIPNIIYFSVISDIPSNPDILRRAKPVSAPGAFGLMLAGAAALFGFRRQALAKSLGGRHLRR